MNVLVRQVRIRHLAKRQVFCRDYLQNGLFLSPTTSLRREIPSLKLVTDQRIFLIPTYLRQSRQSDDPSE